MESPISYEHNSLLESLDTTDEIYNDHLYYLFYPVEILPQQVELVRCLECQVTHIQYYECTCCENLYCDSCAWYHTH
jgi:late competence protein required for DNA uptake (superfamily II DNA/RNA helicase)